MVGGLYITFYTFARYKRVRSSLTSPAVVSDCHVVRADSNLDSDEMQTMPAEKLSRAESHREPKRMVIMRRNC